MKEESAAAMLSLTPLEYLGFSQFDTNDTIVESWLAILFDIRPIEYRVIAPISRVLRDFAKDIGETKVVVLKSEFALGGG